MAQPEYKLSVQIATYINTRYPNVMYHFDVGSGERMSIGQAVKNKRLNKWRGMPDLWIYEVRKNYHGLCIEIKATNPSLTEHVREQRDRIGKLIERGYFAEMCVGFEETKRLIDDYLTL
jgi:cysteinyl-tRNA synthetase